MAQLPGEIPIDEDEDPWAMFRDVVYALSIDEIKERYKDIGIISQNRNCTVRLSIHNKTGQKVVMKILNKNMFTEQKKRLLLYREIQTLRTLGDHKHITQLYEVIDSGDRIWVILEYAAGGELFDFVKAKAPLVESQAREIFRPIVKVVADMHAQNIVHRDLKLENVLLSTKGKIMLADFGFSRYWDPEGGLVDSLCGTAHYVAPEIVKALPHNPMYADSWSLGVILFMLFFGRFPFTGCSIPEMQKSIMQAQLVLPFGLSDLAEDLLHKLITLNPDDRLLPKEIMNHPWYNKNKVPHPKRKQDDKHIMHKTVLRDMGIKEDIGAHEIEKLTEDDAVSYKIIHRRYQLHELQLPIETQHGVVVPNLNDFNKVSVRAAVETAHSVRRKGDAVMGMNTLRVNERLPSLDPYLRVVRVQTAAAVKRPKSSVRIIRKLPEKPIPRRVPRRRFDRPATVNVDSVLSGPLKIREWQTLRLKSIDPSENAEPQLPRMDCKHTTLDPLDDVWKRLLTFLEKECVSIITEQDFGLYLVIEEPEELCVTLNVGCVHPGFGLIGFSLYKVHGDEHAFQQFEANLTEFMGF